MIRVQVPATTANMGPGFDTIGMALDIYNSVEMDEIETGLVIECLGFGEKEIPKDESNTVYQAALKVFDTVKFKPKGIKIRLDSKIPLSSGLGSSAAAIVGGLVAANALSGYKLKESELLNLAAEIEGHPDNVAPALLGGIVISTMNERQVIYSQITAPPSLNCVVAIPEYALATKTSREVLPKEVAFKDAVFNISRVSLLVVALQQGNLDLLSLAMDDKIHQPYRCKLIPGMEKVFSVAKKAGAKSVALSGAGPTLIAFTSGNEVEIMDAIKNTFDEESVKVNLLLVKPNSFGARVL